MSKFKVGDRVAVREGIYGICEFEREFGTVLQLCEDGDLYVCFDKVFAGHRDWFANPEQCRRLNPKGSKPDELDTQVDEIDRLIATANAGQTARERPWKEFHSQWEFVSGTGARYDRYSRKPDPRKARIQELEAELARLKAEASK